MTDHERLNRSKRLREDPKFAAEYLNSALANWSADSSQGIGPAIKEIAEIAGKGNCYLASKTGITRQHLHSLFSSGSFNPTLDTLSKLLLELGLKLRIDPNDSDK